jgi:hypothetical protein
VYWQLVLFVKWVDNAFSKTVGLITTPIAADCVLLLAAVATTETSDVAITLLGAV